MSTRVITPPATEPVTLAEVRAWLQVDDLSDSEETALLSSLVLSARQMVEQYLQCALITQTLESILPLPTVPAGKVSGPIAMPTSWRPWSEDYFALGYRIELPFPPLQSVTTVWLESLPNTWSTITGYTVDNLDSPGSLVITDPLLAPAPCRLRVRYVAGYGLTGASVPEPIRRAILVLINQWSQDRQGMGTLPPGVKALLNPYRLIMLR